MSGGSCKFFESKFLGNLTSLSGSNRSLLPIMETDISVRCGMIRTIIDTKYYRQPLSNRFGPEKFPFLQISYQLFSYLQNASSGNSPVHGMLLYAQVGRSFKERFSIRGSCLTLMTLDLSADWQDIRASLIGLQLTSRS